MNIKRKMNITQMDLHLHRIAKKETYTIGKLYFNGKYFCDTLEDKVRVLIDIGDKKKGETAIPSGRYEVKLTYSPKFKRVLPLVCDVPYFTGIRIHRGNTAKDTEGCILVGENKVVGKVINSTKYEERLVELMKQKKIGEQIWLTID